MPRLLAAPVLALLALATGPAEANAPLRDPRLAEVRTWAFAIGDGTLRPANLARLRAYDLVVIDGEEATPAQVASLKRTGAVVLAYLSVGTIERGRGWYARARPFRGGWWPEWDEYYADVNAAGFRRLITGDVAPAILRKGFDGLFLDNTDMIESFRRQTPGMRTLVAELDRLVSAQGDLLFTQNGEDTIGPSLRHYDGWNREDVTSTYDFDDEEYARVPAAERRAGLRSLRRIRAAGLLVTAADYVRPGDVAITRLAIRAACSAGALPYVADIQLTRVPAAPQRCG